MKALSEKYDSMLNDLLKLCKENLQSVNEELVKKAFRLSYEAHKTGFRDSGEPYFHHPYEVAKIITELMPLDDTTVICALLHDVVEDAGVSINIIKKEFSEKIADIIEGLTKISGAFQGYEITQAENYRKMLLSMVKDIRVIIVKFADRLHNMRTLEFVKPHKQLRIAKETMEIYAPFANRFGLAAVKWELEDLAFRFLNREIFDEIARKLAVTRKDREAYIKKFIKPVIEHLKQYGIKDYEITGRPKHIFSIYRKMIRQNKPFEEIFDLFAVRIILEKDDPKMCYTVLGVINELYKANQERFKDYINIPKKNNYKSIHNTVYGPDGKLVEVQIRTRKMHEIAEKGVAAHWKYKEDISWADKELEDWVNRIREVFDTSTKDEASKELIDSFQLNLYSDEIYIFTPKGDLKRLPLGSTPVDFAYEIHSDVGYHCLGAKVNGKIVPLDIKLNSGDQVEIISSKNQHPNKSWLKFVKTHKAKSHIRRFLNKEEERLLKDGKEIWDKKIKKLKTVVTDEEFVKMFRKNKYDNARQFYIAIAQDKINLDELLIKPKTEESEISEVQFDDFAKIARTTAGDVLIDGEFKGIAYDFAKCCKPIPGDPIIGYVTIGEGIKIHRKDCINLINMIKKGNEKIVPVQWPKSNGSLFVSAIKIKGKDRPGVLKDLSNSIASYKDTNIKAINISAEQSIFEGTIALYVTDLEHLNRIIERLKKHKDVFFVDRYTSQSE
ncbi:MAG: bifunctional (p)ppGpp synthetase/guanosine-3',5'-bis(diphosphate) 3'-pyrophosphohydrolase [Ignavibacteriales bacterium]|nr:bifunctional (p)ppGpp synthetase/guanosine-3',5'-bis(diphosphate) 3'-pyrophosphohydrolase [Ignavibacteriales bacterium]